MPDFLQHRESDEDTHAWPTCDKCGEPSDSLEPVGECEEAADWCPECIRTEVREIRGTGTRRGDAKPQRLLLVGDRPDMSRRGEVTVECSSQTCHAERVMTAEELRYVDADTILRAEGWRVQQSLRDEICPQCIQDEGPKKWS
jgi:hypothetical protein